MSISAISSTNHPITTTVAAIAVVVTITLSVLDGRSGLAVQHESPVLAWPEAFKSEPAEVKWAERTMTGSGLRIRVSVPANWIFRVGDQPEDLVAMDLKAGLRVDFAQMTPTSYNLDEPIPRDKLEQSIKTMQSNVPRGYVVEKAGQVRIGDRLWIWHEQRIPTFDLSMAKQYQEMLRLWPYASARTWSFVATSQSQLVRVYFTVLYPRDAPVSEIDLRTRQAGSVFAAILRHLVFDVV